MLYYQPKHHRRSLRLKKYNYSQQGAYFITICTDSDKCLFGEIANQGMQLNATGEMIQDIWNAIPHFYQGVGIDAFQIMPNHIHGIILINNTIINQESVGATSHGCPPRYGQAWEPAPTLSLPDVVHRFKSMTTKRYLDKSNYQSRNQKLWQRNYYEHVVRDENDLNRIREYITNNPIKWDTHIIGQAWEPAPTI